MHRGREERLRVCTYTRSRVTYIYMHVLGHKWYTAIKTVTEKVKSIQITRRIKAEHSGLKREKGVMNFELRKRRERLLNT